MISLSWFFTNSILICLNNLVLFIMSILPLIPSYLTFILLFIVPKHINIFNSITQGLLNTLLPPCYQYCKPCGLLLASLEVAGASSKSPVAAQAPGVKITNFSHFLTFTCTTYLPTATPQALPLYPPPPLMERQIKMICILPSICGF